VDGVAAPLGPVEVVAPDALELALPREASFRPRVLVVSYNPFLPNAGVRLDQYFGWNDALELAQGIRRAVLEGSGGFVNYQIVDFVERDEFPLHASGFRYTEETYLAETAMDPQWPSGTPTDFPELHRENRIHERVEAGEIDEAWIFGGPGFGYAESWMAGRGAFTINGPIFENDLSRAVPLLGLNYERGVGCALESLGHRIEATLARAHGSWTLGKVDGNAWERFTLYDLVAPGQAAVGTVHFAPNSVEDYDWANPRRVPSTADDWLRYPDLTGATREVGP
jgi:hypothetical protein